MLEGTAGVHNNLVGALSTERAEQLLGYTFEGVAFGQFITVQRVTEFGGGMRGLIGFGLKLGYLISRVQPSAVQSRRCSPGSGSRASTKPDRAALSNSILDLYLSVKTPLWPLLEFL